MDQRTRDLLFLLSFAPLATGCPGDDGGGTGDDSSGTGEATSSGGGDTAVTPTAGPETESGTGGGSSEAPGSSSGEESTGEGSTGEGSSSEVGSSSGETMPSGCEIYIQFYVDCYGEIDPVYQEEYIDNCEMVMADLDVQYDPSCSMLYEEAMVCATALPCEEFGTAFDPGEPCEAEAAALAALCSPDPVDPPPPGGPGGGPVPPPLP